MRAGAWMASDKANNERVFRTSIDILVVAARRAALGVQFAARAILTAAWAMHGLFTAAKQKQQSESARMTLFGYCTNDTRV